MPKLRGRFAELQAAGLIEDAAPLFLALVAPGFHGANATGRPFTGDHAGLLLYRTLHRFGFASQPESKSRDDALKLIGCRISNSVKCVPPENKPTPRCER